MLFAEPVHYGVGEGVEGVGAGERGRLTVTGQIDGYYFAVGGQLIKDGTPGVAGAAEAVDKQERFAGAVAGVVQVHRRRRVEVGEVARARQATASRAGQVVEVVVRGSQLNSYRMGSLHRATSGRIRASRAALT